MEWKIFDNWKQGKLGEVETEVSVETKSLINFSAAIFIAGLLILFTWYALKKKLQ